jgi:hypothetical protein
MTLADPPMTRSSALGCHIRKPARVGPLTEQIQSMFEGGSYWTPAVAEDTRTEE